MVITCFALVIVVFGLVGAVAFWPPSPASGQYTADDAIAAARQFVTGEGTFAFDGVADTLKFSLNRTVGGGVFEVVAEFTSRNAGFGDRTGDMVATVLTPHRAIVTVDNGAVAAAVMDGQWDMVAQKDVGTTAPPSTMPALEPGRATPPVIPGGAQ